MALGTASYITLYSRKKYYWFTKKKKKLSECLSLEKTHFFDDQNPIKLNEELLYFLRKTTNEDANN